MSPMPRGRRAREQGGAPGVTAEERQVLGTLAPLRRTVTSLVTRMHEALGPSGELDARRLEADVEALWTVVLEAYRRGVGAVHAGMHRAEGIDHAMADEALDFALREIREGGRRG